MGTSDHKIINADCMDAMADMDENSVHAIVTDPPYNFEGGFMGEEWDNVGTAEEYQAWCEQWATECLQVLKPGGHLIAFSSTGTYHRLASGIENAGFEIRDQLDWNYGQGFPKGATVSQWMDGEAAEQWSGWKTALKPAHEPAVLARAPMSESAVYRNVLEHGTGALNIDRTRITLEGIQEHWEDYDPSEKMGYHGEADDATRSGDAYNPDGRYPANFLLDPIASQMLDSQSGELDPGGNGQKHRSGESMENGVYGDGYTRSDVAYTDEGGASRFFYTAKSSKSERTINGQVDNEHPTVKPLDLMEYLVTLVTAPGQRVLDPFAGSGTTIMACRRLGRGGIGIEQDADHAELARKRVDLAHELETGRVDATDADGSDDQPDDSPTTLESFGDD